MAAISVSMVVKENPFARPMRKIAAASRYLLRGALNLRFELHLSRLSAQVPPNPNLVSSPGATPLPIFAGPSQFLRMAVV
jgi:hypothetical protein